MAEHQVPEDLQRSSENVPIPENLTREEYVQMAKLAKEEKRFRDMVKIMEKIVVGLNPPVELTVDERNLLAFAYKTVFFTLQTAWLKANHDEDDADTLEEKSHVMKARAYKFEIEAEILELLDGFQKLLKDKLVPSASTSESKVYYLTLRGDYYKQLLKYKYEKIKADCLDAYNEAQEIANKDLDPLDPTCLRLALNFSAFYREILKSPRKGFDMAREAHDQAKAKLDALKGEALQERAVLLEPFLERLRDFLKLVISEEEELEAAREFAKSFADMDLAR